MSSESFYDDYWDAFSSLFGAYSSGLPKASQHNYYIRFPRSGFGFQRSALAVRSKGYIGVEFICETGTAGQARARLDALREATPTETLATYPGEIEWYGPARMKIAKAWETIPARLEERADWPAQHLWLYGRLMLLETILGPVARSLETK
ncbi:hypothetical protein [Tabrizicola sp.]|uniref:hypothetical protein n=1 Tax=Tabrizicola sp. TaxID=2005166 RepID=UPI002732AE50|nr:hypothetical protein [Tabrizicola sp.]MDP3195486.1 hypothetical protein [Tabrizicola sp.]MDZ4065710.1 hypothetical protein [Tabrizicola sp.]